MFVSLLISIATKTSPGDRMQRQGCTVIHKCAALLAQRLRSHMCLQLACNEQQLHQNERESNMSQRHALCGYSYTVPVRLRVMSITGHAAIFGFLYLLIS